MKHQALSHCTGEGNLHSPRFGSPRSLWGCLGFLFPVPENKSTQTIQSYVLPCQTHPETHWDEEKTSLSKEPVVFNAPPNRQPETEQGHNPCHHYICSVKNLSVFHRENPTALATATWWAIASSLPQLKADLQIGNQTAPSLERLGLTWTHTAISDRSSTSGWFTTSYRVGCSSFLDSQHPH